MHIEIHEATDRGALEDVVRAVDISVPRRASPTMVGHFMKMLLDP